MIAYNMVLMLDGNSEIRAQVRNNLCYLICLMHLIRSRAVTDLILFFLLHMCATFSELLSNIITMIVLKHFFYLLALSISAFKCSLVEQEPS